MSHTTNYDTLRDRAANHWSHIARLLFPDIAACKAAALLGFAAGLLGALVAFR